MSRAYDAISDALNVAAMNASLWMKSDKSGQGFLNNDMIHASGSADIQPM